MVVLLAVLVQSPVVNDELGYRFTLPSPFVPFPEAKAQSADIVDCWQEEGEGGVVLCIQRMHGVLPHDAMKVSDIPDTTVTQLTRFRWKEFVIQGLRTTRLQDGVHSVAIVAQVPLKPEAIQVVASSPLYQEEHARAMLEDVLASLEGQSNWLTSAQRSERMGKAVGTWIAIGVAVLVVVILRKRRAA